MDAVPLPEGVLFRSATLSVRVTGTASDLLRERLLPLLERDPDGWITLADDDQDGETLRPHLESLVEARVLRRGNTSAELAPGGADPLSPLLDLLEELDSDSAEARERLRASRVAIVGLEGPGAWLAALLARCGVGTVELLDPFPCEPANLATMPPQSENAIGARRQEAVRRVLEGLGDARFPRGPDPLTRAAIGAAVRRCDLLVGCFDRGFASAHHWINREATPLGIATIYAELRAHRARVGPFVIPGETACYMCYRMRSLACDEHFADAMAQEEYLDRSKQPALHRRPGLPPLSGWTGSVLALEVLKRLLSLPLALAGHVLELDAFSLATDLHPILRKPDCPVCGPAADDRAADAV